MAGADRDVAWRIAAGGLVLRVRVTPKSSRDGVDGVQSTADGPAIKVRVRALPEDGAANAAVEQLIAGWLGLARRDVALISGAKSRVKVLSLAGSPEELACLIAAALAGESG